MSVYIGNKISKTIHVHVYICVCASWTDSNRLIRCSQMALKFDFDELPIVGEKPDIT